MPMLEKEDSNKTQRTLIYTNLGEARNSATNPIHHESRMIILEDSSLSPVRENSQRQDSPDENSCRHIEI